jgi:antitoxin CptB
MKGVLRWRCRRGMRELDAILLPFVEQHYDHLSEDLQQRFADWLELPDPTLWSLLTSRSSVLPDDLELIRLIFRDEGTPIA